MPDVNEIPNWHSSAGILGMVKLMLVLIVDPDGIMSMFGFVIATEIVLTPKVRKTALSWIGL